ncbi:MAG: DUF1343 domain-containing protein [Saprospiraceae bacterium]|nr:DUF1343 domain-containing protein [Saprospiraceae bacterium]
MHYILLITFFSFLLHVGCTEHIGAEEDTKTQVQVEPPIQTGAAQLEQYLPLVDGKQIAMLVNHTSILGEEHLVDRLLKEGVDIKTIFAPEHGFRGTADAGAKILDGTDAQTGLPVVSLYGQKRKPSPKDLADIDLVLFDIQDVGARFYTYISSMTLMMEACAENDVPMIVLDRPNPNGHYVDGPVLEPEFKSFVGMHSVPVVYGMTIGEYAKMVNGEGWLANGVACDLTVIPCAHYRHDRMYELPEKPSPNLPNLRSVLLYPSLCFFEGTPFSIGRGTNKQFQVIGHPTLEDMPFSFTPSPHPGAMNPRLNGSECVGIDLTEVSPESLYEYRQLDLSYLFKFYAAFQDRDAFFNSNKWFDKLAGTTSFRTMMKEGKSEADIRASWEKDLSAFKDIRQKYLIYP